jgi:hypothetical protein
VLSCVLCKRFVKVLPPCTLEYNLQGGKGGGGGKGGEMTQTLYSHINKRKKK